MDQVDSESTPNPTDLSIEAVLELAEIQNGIRKDAPSMGRLFELLKTPTPSFEGAGGISMLADVRSYAIFRDSLHQANPKLRAKNFREVPDVMKDFFAAAEKGVAAGEAQWVEIAKRFCSAINSNLLAKQMGDIYSRRERSDARYIGHESSS